VILLKTILKVLTIVIFVGLLIFMYFYFQHEKNTDLTGKDPTDIASNYDSYLDDLQEPLNTRLTYDKEMLFVYVQEMNNDVLKDFSIEHLVANEINFNEETEAIYFYDQNNIPPESTELIVLQEIYNLDFLLNQSISYSYDTSTKVYFHELTYASFEAEKQPVENEQRLFLDESISIRQVDDSDAVVVEYNEDTYQLNRGESKDFIIEKDHLKSRLLIRYFGFWETTHMKYEITD